MSKKLIYILLAVSLGINVGVVATTVLHRASHPQGLPPGPGGGAPPPGQPGSPPDPARLVESHLQGITRHLGLDADQQRVVRAVLEQYAPQLIELQAETSRAAQRLTDLFGAPTFDPERFRKLTAETGAARSRLDSLSAVMLVAEAAVLTPEQRLKYAEVAPSIHSRPRQPRHGPGGPGGPDRPGGPPRR